ncbi:MAG TPA: prolipoprotein diacylglyceryl transferase [Chitinophagaceae bacterium]|nr:prolipoprotein diacylglyceryl transferase [Chitinophagaceae bacterium]MCB9056442.1 prolipoprotein diacylglyceryl transferase [Chitinophagales bacterium]HPG12313.1 prolipoprotein diacylglyceryl transferase [Chitinophagaceae bacterium]HRX94551.1 prolipoprotein diacylglyceryl transferase [Chitinophagaceae bacterium]
MYPNLYYAFKDLFGVEWTFLRFVNTFGFFVAIGFIVSAVVLTAELRRKSKLGLFKPTEMQVMVGKPASFSDLALNFLLGFLLGYKIVALFILDNSATEDPQAFIFSTLGSWPAGIALGLLFAGLKWWEKNKTKLDKPEKRTIRIWPQDRVGEITILALVFGLLGAKIFDIFENWSGFLENPSDYIFSAKGLTFYGGLILAGIAIVWYARKHKIGIRYLSDAFAPTMMLAYSIGRIGCHVAGDGDWGIRSNLANKPGFLPDWMWSYRYPHNVNEMDPNVLIPGCEGKFCNQLAFGVYPTPLYEVIVCFILFLLIWALRKRFKIPGTLFAFYLMLNGIERFFIEKIRVNTRMDIFGFQPTQAEVISSLLFLGGLALWIILYRLSNQKKST